MVATKGIEKRPKHCIVAHINRNNSFVVSDPVKTKNAAGEKGWSCVLVVPKEDRIHYNICGNKYIVSGENIEMFAKSKKDLLSAVKHKQEKYKGNPFVKYVKNKQLKIG